MTFYKVVRIKNNDGVIKRVSWATDGDFEVEYIPNEFVFSKHPLFIFDRLGRATEYRHRHDELWEVEAVNPRVFATQILPLPANVDKFWEYYNSGKLKYGVFDVSVWIADQVKLVRRLI